MAFLNLADTCSKLASGSTNTTEQTFFVKQGDSIATGTEVFVDEARTVKVPNGHYVYNNTPFQVTNGVVAMKSC